MIEWLDQGHWVHPRLGSLTLQPSSFTLTKRRRVLWITRLHLLAVWILEICLTTALLNFTNYGILGAFNWPSHASFLHATTSFVALHDRNAFFPSLWYWQIDIKVSAGWVVLPLKVVGDLFLAFSRFWWLRVSFNSWPYSVFSASIVIWPSPLP